MALATKCPHCNTVFRVAHDQLKLRGGIVRCGSCNEVFDGNAALQEPAAVAPAATSAVVPTPIPDYTPANRHVPAPYDAEMAAIARTVLELDDDEPIHTLEFDSAFDAEHSAAQELGPEPTPEPESEPDQEPDQQREPVLDVETEPAFTPEAIDEPPFALPIEPVVPEPVAEEALELDLDVEPEPEPKPAPEPEPVPEPVPEPESAPLLIDPAAVKPMSHEELEAALAVELAAIEEEKRLTAEAEQAAVAAANPPAERLEPSLEEASPFELDEADEEALAQLSAAAQAEAQAKAVHGTTLLRAASAPPLHDRVHTIDEQAAPEPAIEPASEPASEPPAAPVIDDEPGFVKRARRRDKYGLATTIAMSVGALLLLGGLAAQALTTFRNPLAAAMPALKPALLAACETFGCKIELPTQVDELVIDQGELQTLSETTFSFSTQLRNGSRTAQAWPHIELVLDDANDKAVLRRVFTPRDYLGPDVTLEKGFAPHTEQPVKLYFELNQLKASGYHIAVFYP